MTIERLRNRDLRAVLAGAQTLSELRDSAEFHAAILPLLRGLVRVDIASFNVIDLAAGTAERPMVDPPDAYFDPGRDVLGAYAHQNPLIGANRQDAIKLSDYLTRRDLHRLEIYRLIYASIRVEYQIAFTVSAPGDKVVGFALSRTRPDFSEYERAVLNAVRPFVALAYERVTAPPPLMPAEALGLTTRQAQILQHLARGLTSAQIALAMNISERTVHKHLENTYARLGVPSRSAAVARGLGLG